MICLKFVSNYNWETFHVFNIQMISTTVDYTELCAIKNVNKDFAAS